jgi:hypothetical protein
MSYKSEAVSFSGGPGGEKYDEASYEASRLRAELVEVASRVDLRLAPRFADLVLSEYEVERRVHDHLW